MGNSGLAQLQKKYKNEGIDYVLSKYHQRKSYETLNDDIKSLKQNANKLEKLDHDFILQQKKLFQNQFKQCKKQAIQKNPTSIEQAEARTKQPVQKFSGYNDELKKIQTVQKQLKEKYQKQRVKLQEKVHQQVKSHQKNSSVISKIPEYDQKPQNYKKSLQNECLKKYPSRSQQLNKTAELHKKIQWTNFKANFQSILDQQKLKKDLQEANKRIKQNIVPQGAPVCC